MELTKIIKKLESLSSAGVNNSPKIFIGGSYALKNVYNVTKKEPGDIDVIIYNFNEKQLDWIKEHFDINYCGDYGTTWLDLDKNKNTFYIQAFLDRKSVTVNFITYKDYTHLNYYAITFNSIPVVPLKAIIDAKLEYNRPKDKADLLDIIMELNTPRQTHSPYKTI
jgi:hypothetical protein